MIQMSSDGVIHPSAEPSAVLFGGSRGPEVPLGGSLLAAG